MTHSFPTRRSSYRHGKGHSMAKQNADVNGERRTLWIVLLLNSAIAAAFLVTGAIGDSSALIAHGLYNLSDAAAYALSLVALTRALMSKTRAPKAHGPIVRILPDAAALAVDPRSPQV